MKILINERQEQLISQHNNGLPLREEFLPEGKTIINEEIATKIGSCMPGLVCMRFVVCSKYVSKL